MLGLKKHGKRNFLFSFLTRGAKKAAKKAALDALSTWNQYYFNSYVEWFFYHLAGRYTATTYPFLTEFIAVTSIVPVKEFIHFNYHGALETKVEKIVIYFSLEEIDSLDKITFEVFFTEYRNVAMIIDKKERIIEFDLTEKYVQFDEI